VRITSSSYYNNIYGENNKLNKQLFDVNKQISSGLKIQYAHEDPGVFIDTLRLDDEITTLNQVKSSAQSAYKLSTQTDTTVGELVKTLESMKVKIVNSANAAHSDASIQAIAKELRGLQNHLRTLANTSIGGQYLFSGTATSVKPIGTDGTYQGNDKDLEAFLGSGVKQKYNISGEQLFLGDENKVNRTITTNVPQKSLTDLYPDVMQDTSIPRSAAKESYITESSTIRDLMGDTDAIADSTTDPKSHFYIQGTRHDGSTFKTHFDMESGETIQALMDNIALQYDPNLTNPDLVNVSINAHGQIEIVDKQAGSSKLDFHMVGAVDFDNTNAGDAADISDGALYAATVGEIDNLQTGSPNFETAAVTTPGLYVKEFTKSSLDTPPGVSNSIEGINYDRTNFEQDGAKLISNVSQTLISDNSYAVPKTKLSEVGIIDTTLPLPVTTIRLQGKQIGGLTDYDISISLGNPSSFTDNIGSSTFDIYGSAFNDDGDGIKESAEGIATNGSDVTYQQLMDIVNMAVTGKLPTATNDPVAYDDAIKDANNLGKVTLDYAGKIVFEDKNNTKTKASLSIYDASSSSYATTDGPALTFNANSALTIRDPKTDFFTQIEEIIKSVEEGKVRADGSDSSDPRNLGIQNAIQSIDDLSDHVSRLQTEVGSYSQVLQASSDRTDMLLISTKTLQSDIIDTDIAEATLRMQQLSLNYQAMLSSISKVSQLSLVNYL